MFLLKLSFKVRWILLVLSYSVLELGHEKLWTVFVGSLRYRQYAERDGRYSYRATAQSGHAVTY